MAAVGECDPTYAGLQDVYRQAVAQAQVRPVRIGSSKVFIEQAKKRITAGLPCAGGSDDSSGQCALRRTPGWPKPRFVWQPSSSRSPTEAVLPPTVPAYFAQELAALRVSVQQLQRENADFRSQLHTGTRCEERERKHQQTARWTWGRVFTEFQNPLAGWKHSSTTQRQVCDRTVSTHCPADHGQEPSRAGPIRIERCTCGGGDPSVKTMSASKWLSDLDGHAN